jgi:hypothetical protein
MNITYTDKVDFASGVTGTVSAGDMNMIKTAVNSKVDSVVGKGLSTEDYTTAEKTKLTNIAVAATANSADSFLLARGNHTGVQAAATITEDTNHRFVTDTEKSTWNAKQAALLSGTNLKTINGGSLLGSGNITISAGTIDSTPISGSSNAVSSDGVFTSIASRAPINSPAFTGNPTATTQTTGDNSTKLATTAFVQQELVANTLYFDNSQFSGPGTSGSPITILSSLLNGNFLSLTKNKARMAPKEKVTVLANTPYTILSVSGSGTVKSIWQTMSNNTGAINKEARLQVFVDGEVTPSVDVAFGELFLSRLGAMSHGFQWGTDHIHGEGGIVFGFEAQGGFMNFPIPYLTGCIIKVNSTVQIDNYYSQIHYVPGLTAPFRLKSKFSPFDTPALTLNSTDEADLFTTPTGSEGWMVYFGYTSQATGGSDSFLERNFQFTVDSEVTPSIVSTGGEDFFLGSYYFLGRTSYSTPCSAVSWFGDHEAHVCLDLNKYMGGIYFSDNLKMTIKSEAAVTVGHKMGFVALFYTPTTSAWGTPASTPTVPDAPTGLVATGGDTQASVAFSAPLNDGGSTITGYTITSSPGSHSATGTTSPITVPGLTNGVAYTFTGKAINSVGNSIASSASNSVTPATVTVPSAPTGVSASAGNAQASVSFTPSASNGGSAITGYTATSNPGGLTATGSGSPIVVPGLTNGTAYTFTVHATNAIGNSFESTASSAVTPTGIVTYLLDTFTGADTTTGLSSHTPDTNTASGTWAAEGSGSPSAGIISNKAYFSAATDGVESNEVIDGGHADGTFEWDFTTSAATNRILDGVVFRYINSDNYIRISFVKVSGTNAIELWKSVSGSRSLVTSYTGITIAESTTYHIQAICSGTSVIIKVDGTTIITTTIAENTTFTKLGFCCQKNSGQSNLGCRWDNIKVTN